MTKMMLKSIMPVILTLVGSGCTINVVNFEQSSNAERWPLIELPDRPIVQSITSAELRPVTIEVAQKIISNEQGYQNYIRNLEGRIKEYNSIAAGKNEGRKQSSERVSGALKKEGE